MGPERPLTEFQGPLPENSPPVRTSAALSDLAHQRKLRKDLSPNPAKTK